MTAVTLLGGRYRLQRTLGHGGMSVVELAEDIELLRTVAVKVLADNLAHDAEVRRRFVREARLAASLAHPNVVRVFDVGEDGGRPFLVMEYVEGETVADIARRDAPLSASRAVEVVVQACAGLDAAHEAGLVHRDVKPQNLLVRRDGVVKLADFGIARAATGTQLTQAGTVLGTAAYVAPEQLAGDEVTRAADVYGIGAVLYELLTGVPPRRAETLSELGAGLANPIVPPRDLNASVSPALERVLMRCLARLPQERPRSAGELAQELLAAIGEAPTRPLPPQRPAPANRRPPIAVAVAAVLLAAAGIGLGVGLSSRGGSSPSQSAPPPARVAPVPHSDDPAQEARNLAKWLRRNSR